MPKQLELGGLENGPADPARYQDYVSTNMTFLSIVFRYRSMRQLY
jgi:hypothetical protein